MPEHKAFFLALVSTVVYLLFLPVAIFCALASGMVFDKGISVIFFQYLVIIMGLFLPISILISLILMWVYYWTGNYKRLKFFSMFPVFIFFAFLLAARFV